MITLMMTVKYDLIDQFVKMSAGGRRGGVHYWQALSRKEGKTGKDSKVKQFFPPAL